MKNKIRGLKAITELNKLKLGENFLLISNQFAVANKVKLTEFDSSGLNRNLAYFQYTEEPKEQPFCIWQHELNNTCFLFPFGS